MSKTKPTIGISFAEKLIGILMLIIGASLVYNTQTYSAAAGLAASFVLAIGIILAIAGVLLVITKTSYSAPPDLLEKTWLRCSKIRLKTEACFYG